MFKQGQEIFDILQEVISEGVVIVDSNQKIVEVNKSVEQLFSYDRSDLIDQPLDTLIPNKHRVKHGGHFKQFMKAKESRQMGLGRELYGQRKDGSVFPVEVGLNPFKVNDETFIMAIVIDITKRKEAESELKHWANIFNESLNEIYIFNTTDFRFLNVNLGAQKNIGYTLEELKKITPITIKPEFTPEKFKTLVAPLLNQEKKKLIFETVHERKDGSTYPVEVHLQLSHLVDQLVFVAIILDITKTKNYTTNLENIVAQRTQQLKEALDKEKELNELKTKFLSLVSHEFKTPLSGILTSATLLQKYTTEAQQVRREKHIRTIIDKVYYLNNILNDFLSMERLEKGKVKYNNTTFNVSKVVNEVVYGANLLLKEGQKINYPDAIDHIALYQDEKIVELALSNLVQNAIKYSSESNTIDIAILQDNDFTVFKVSDQGIGIPEKDQKNIFNRYFRAENVLLTQGTGIGLNIVKHHLENLGGSIVFTSQENKGSTFTFKIPNKATNEESTFN